MKCARWIVAAAIALTAEPLSPRAVLGQVMVGADFGVVMFKGATESTSPAESTTLRPGGPARHGVRATVEFGRWDIGLGIHRSRVGLAGVRNPLVILDRSALKMWTFEPTVGRRVLGTRESSQLWLEAGPQFDLWLLTGEDFRVKVGGAVALSLLQRITRRLGSSLRVRASRGPSLFEASELPPELKAASLWQVGLDFGLDFRL